MSWSVLLIGTPANIAKALEDESAKLDGQSKIEFDAAKPHLAALVLENFANAEPYITPLVQLEAGGHGYATGTPDNTQQVYRTIQVKITPLYGRLV